MLFLLLIPLLFLFLLVPLNIKLNYIRDGKNDEFYLTVFLLVKPFGLRVVIPYMQFNLFKPLVKIFADIDTYLTDLMSKRGEEKMEREINGGINDLKKMFKNVFKKKEIIRVFIENLKINLYEFCWKTEFGTGNAAHTGILTGIIWSIKGVIVSSLGSRMNKFSGIQIKVNPVFNKRTFKTRLRCIFSVKLGNIILATLKVVVYKFKGGTAKCQNIRLKN